MAVSLAMKVQCGARTPVESTMVALHHQIHF